MSSTMTTLTTPRIMFIVLVEQHEQDVQAQQSPCSLQKVSNPTTCLVNANYHRCEASKGSHQYLD